MRARLIKPGFFKSDELAELSPLTRILFSGLWCLADREGRLKDRPKVIKAEVLPYDDADADALLDELARAGFIRRYADHAGRYIQVVNPKKWYANTDDKFDGTRAEARRLYQALIYARDAWKCVRCGNTSTLTLDHITPLSRGGTNNPDNLQTLCRSCNSRKGAR